MPPEGYSVFGERKRDSVPYTHSKKIHMSYLKEGDRFVGVRTLPYTSKVDVISGVTTMDGHAVSLNYGYINVRFDGVQYTEPWAHPNDSIYERDGYEIYVTEKVAARAAEDEASNEEIKRTAAAASKEAKEARERELKKRQIFAEIEVLRKLASEL